MIPYIKTQIKRPKWSHTLLFSRASAEWCSLAPKQLWHFNLLKMFGSNFLHFNAMALCLHYFPGIVVIIGFVLTNPFSIITNVTFFIFLKHCFLFALRAIDEGTTLLHFRNDYTSTSSETGVELSTGVVIQPEVKFSGYIPSRRRF